MITTRELIKILEVLPADQVFPYVDLRLKNMQDKDVFSVFTYEGKTNVTYTGKQGNDEPVSL